MKILYEDKYMLVCEKPVGVESQISNKNKADMPTLLSQYRRERGENSYIGVVHRLDTATGGVMIYSKREDMTGKLSALVQSADYEKTYLAVAHGTPEETSGEMRDLLFHDKMKNKSFVCSKKRSGVKAAILNYRVLGTAEREDGDPISLLEIKLITGRTHQIRVQLASRKMPLVGDGKYHSTGYKAPNILVIIGIFAIVYAAGYGIYIIISSRIKSTKNEKKEYRPVYNKKNKESEYNPMFKDKK